jgi:hypothetical protein
MKLGVLFWRPLDQQLSEVRKESAVSEHNGSFKHHWLTVPVRIKLLHPPRTNTSKSL